MFGQNPVRHAEKLDVLQVRDVWYTLQGEGPFSGHSAIFIRLTGCNLRCEFCDTEWSDDKDEYVSPRSLVARANNLKPSVCNLVVITGGEPLRQDLDELIYGLARCFDIVQLETAGTYWQPCLNHSSVQIIVSPKTPKIHPKIYEHAHAFKYVISANELGEDGLPVYSTQKRGEHAILARPRPGAPVYLSPMDEQQLELNNANLRAVAAAAQKHGFIAGVQLHKLLDVP